MQPYSRAPLRVAVLGLFHESNTFAPVAASLERFMASGPAEGDEILARYADSQATLAGYVEAANDDPAVELVPLVHFDLTPMGTITAEAFETLVGRMTDALTDGGPWDAVLLALHGAAVAEHHRDADGEILARVRRVVGEAVAIGVSLDMHANVSPRMVTTPTVVNTYMTNPHVDARLRGREVADLVFAAARGEIRPVTRAEHLPLVVNILRQGTSDEPMRGLVALAHQLAVTPGVLSVSLAQGFPYADVEEMGLTVLATTDGDPQLAAEIARTLASVVWHRRHDLQGAGVPIDAALVRAASCPERPVVLLDVGDNVFGGSPGDSTHVLAAAQRLGVRGVFQSICDADAVDTCAAAGIGVRVELDAGGRTDARHGSPVRIAGIVRHLDDGRFEDGGPTHGGRRFFDSGPRAVVDTDDGNTVLLTSRPMGNVSRQELMSAGIDPLVQPIIVAKGVQSPRAAYEPIAAMMVQLDSPGCTTAEVTSLPYLFRRRPMFPYEADATSH